MSDEKNEAKKLYPVTIDYGMSKEEMIRAGDYDHVSCSIKEGCIVSGNGVVMRDFELVHVGDLTTITKRSAYLESHGLRPARIAELLAFGATFPEIQREFPIVALGSICINRRMPYVLRWDFGEARSVECHRMPVLDMFGKERCLQTIYEDELSAKCRLLAVRK
jgi:hypothetical protein